VQGYRYLIARISNEKSFLLFESCGAKKLNELSFNIREGKVVKLWLILLHMENPKFIRSVEEAKQFRNNSRN
jgi:hypothetical protein